MQEHEVVQVGQKAVLIRDGRVLILEGSAHPGTWDLPGGRINQGEDPATALRRELEEELGARTIEILDLVHYDVWYRPNKVNILLIGHLISSPQKDFTLSKEHLSMAWVAQDELSKYEFFTPILQTMIQKGFEFLKTQKNEK